MQPLSGLGVTVKGLCAGLWTQTAGAIFSWWTSKTYSVAKRECRLCLESIGLTSPAFCGHACIPVQVKLEVFPVGRILGVSVLADGMKGSGLSSLL